MDIEHHLAYLLITFPSLNDNLPALLSALDQGESVDVDGVSNQLLKSGLMTFFRYLEIKEESNDKGGTNFSYSSSKKDKKKKKTLISTLCKILEKSEMVKSKNRLEPSERNSLRYYNYWKSNINDSGWTLVEDLISILQEIINRGEVKLEDRLVENSKFVQFLEMLQMECVDEGSEFMFEEEMDESVKDGLELFLGCLKDVGEVGDSIMKGDEKDEMNSLSTSSTLNEEEGKIKESATKPPSPSVMKGPSLPTSLQLRVAKEKMRVFEERKEEGEELNQDGISRDFGPLLPGQEGENENQNQEEKKGFGSHDVLESLFGDLVEENERKDLEMRRRKQSNYSKEQEEEMRGMINQKRASLPSLSDQHSHKLSNKKRRMNPGDEMGWDRERDMESDIGGVKKLSTRDATKLIQSKGKELSTRFSKPSFL